MVQAPCCSAVIHSHDVGSSPVLRYCHRHDSWISAYQTQSRPRMQTYTHPSHTVDRLHTAARARLCHLQQHSLICKPDCSLCLLALAMIRGCHLWLCTFVSTKPEETAWLALLLIRFEALNCPNMTAAVVCRLTLQSGLVLRMQFVQVCDSISLTGDRDQAVAPGE